MFIYIAKFKEDIVLDIKLEAYLKENDIEIKKYFEKLDLYLIESKNKISTKTIECFEILEIENNKFSV